MCTQENWSKFKTVSEMLRKIHNLIWSFVLPSCCRLIIYGSFNVKLMFSKKATKIDEIFTVDLTVCSKFRLGCAKKDLGFFSKVQGTLEVHYLDSKVFILC